MIGVLLICLSGIWASAFLIKRENERVGCVRALLTLVEYTRSAVENYSMSASEILRSVGKEVILECGYQGELPPESFTLMCNECKVEDTEARRVFFEFANDFGKNYRERQSEKCSECAMALKRRYDELAAEAGTRKKMITALCLCFTLALVILLL